MKIIYKDQVKKELAIIIPAYNEEASIKEVLDEWYEVAKACNGNIVIIDDGSTDQTLPNLVQIATQYPLLIIISKTNSGHASTCLQGYQWAIEEGYEWIFQTDSDGQTVATDFQGFWDNRFDSSFIFGQRVKRGDGKIRYLISKILKLAIYIIFKVKVIDANVPFRLMSAVKLKPYIKQIPENFFLSNAYLTVLLSKNKEITWRKIQFINRQSGVPSVKLIGFFKVGIRVITEFWKHRCNLK